MTLALRPNAKETFEMYPEFNDDLNKLEVELDNVLQKYQLNLLQLMRKLAPTCPEMIVYCQVHGEPRFSEDCCNTSFHTLPNFSAFGTCYTTKNVIWESIPLTYSSHKIWFYLPDEDYMAPIDWIIGINDAVGSKGLIYTMSFQDIPMKLLAIRQFRASLGSHSIIGLNKEDIDRRSIGDCQLRNNREFFKRFRMRNTLLNCQIRAEEELNIRSRQCSLQTYYGLADEGNRPCLPKDRLITGAISYNETQHCLIECLNILFKPYITTSDASISAIKDYVLRHHSVNHTKAE